MLLKLWARFQILYQALSLYQFKNVFLYFCEFNTTPFQFRHLYFVIICDLEYFTVYNYVGVQMFQLTG